MTTEDRRFDRARPGVAYLAARVVFVTDTWSMRDILPRRCEPVVPARIAPGRPTRAASVASVPAHKYHVERTKRPLPPPIDARPALPTRPHSSSNSRASGPSRGRRSSRIHASRKRRRFRPRSASTPSRWRVRASSREQARRCDSSILRACRVPRRVPVGGWSLRPHDTAGGGAGRGRAARLRQVAPCRDGRPSKGRSTFRSAAGPRDHGAPKHRPQPVPVR